ncbi:hypothetical protein [Prauserella salsuginis]|uniref:Secreted protein n=1 Tax=Prauserella sediminis TaxID=577680 RepID=A0A839XPH5_9PSEU|nr:hypothetical protein [Prauserella sediminis]MCR3723120.1 hypothetical protein [Prauserella flava]MCR3732505.1 hypothetical protein [Prauserella salsuginis]
MKRLFWLGVGVAAGVTLSRKASETARQATPVGVASNVGDAVRELAGAIGAFGADVRAGMSEREQELNRIVDRPVTRVRPPESGRPEQQARVSYPESASPQTSASGQAARRPPRPARPAGEAGQQGRPQRRARAPRAEG